MMTFPSQVQIYGDSILKGVQLDQANQNIFFRRKIIWNAGANTSPSPCRTIPNLAAPWKKAFKLSGANWRNGKKPRAAIQWFFWNTAATTPTMIGRRLTPILPGLPSPHGTSGVSPGASGHVEFVREQGMTPVMMNLPPVDSIKYLNWLCRSGTGIQKENLLQWLRDPEIIYRHQESCIPRRSVRWPGKPIRL